MYSTLLLDRTVWDLCLDASGNIALASPVYSLAQDAASAIRLFDGELFYDTSLGIPYFADILGQPPPVQLMKAVWVAAAMTVPGVASAVAFITMFDGRQIVGQIQITTIDGQVVTASVGTTASPFILGTSDLGGPDVI